MAMPALRRMLVVLGNVTVMMMTLSGECHRRRQGKSRGNSHEQTKIAKHRFPPAWSTGGRYTGSTCWGKEKGAGSGLKQLVPGRGFEPLTY
jgi:hypothetical protein